MVDKSVFMETIKDVAEIVRTSAEPMGKDEILSYFKDMSLTPEQENLVLEYILTPHEEPETTAEEEEPETAEDNSESVEDSVVLKMYLEEIAELPSYNEDEMKELYEKLFSGEAEVVKTISNAWLVKVVELSRKNNNSSIHLEDLIQEGNIGLFMKLTDLLGGEPVADVENVIEAAIEDTIKSYISEDLSEEDIENAILGKVSLVDAAVKYLAGENGKEPTVYELSEYTKMSLAEIDDVMNFMKIAEENEKKTKKK